MSNQIRFASILVIIGTLITTSIGSLAQENRSVGSDTH